MRMHDDGRVLHLWFFDTFGSCLGKMEATTRQATPSLTTTLACLVSYAKRKGSKRGSPGTQLADPQVLKARAAIKLSLSAK